VSRVITLTTDFGGSDTYVAAMKGVLLSLVPDIQIVDVTHEIDAQDIWGGAYSVSTLMGLFPTDTIHIVVVDPGVGSDRKGMILETEHGLYVAPDNGVLTPLLDREPIRAVSIANPEVMRPVVSATFHGRDVFAPAAGHLAMGEPLSNFGEPIDKPVRLGLWEVERGDGWVRGRIVHIDRFGNAVTNLDRRDAPMEEEVEVSVASTTARGVRRTYADVGEGEVLALVGSQETVEISVRGGSASEQLDLRRGDQVEMRWWIA